MDQECIHSIKVKKLKSLVLTLDLVKVYDLVNSFFLKLVLLQIGPNLETINFIMGCVSSTNFA